MEKYSPRPKPLPSLDQLTPAVQQEIVTFMSRYPEVSEREAIQAWLDSEGYHNQLDTRLGDEMKKQEQAALSAYGQTDELFTPRRHTGHGIAPAPAPDMDTDMNSTRDNNHAQYIQKKIRKI